MSSNEIIQKIDLKKTVTKGSQAVRLSAATVTESWTRPAFAVQASKDGFAKAVQNANKALPSGTAEIAMRQVFLFDLSGNWLMSVTNLGKPIIRAITTSVIITAEYAMMRRAIHSEPSTFQEDSVQQDNRPPRRLQNLSQ